MLLNRGMIVYPGYNLESLKNLWNNSSKYGCLDLAPRGSDLVGAQVSVSFLKLPVDLMCGQAWELLKQVDENPNCRTRWGRGTFSVKLVEAYHPLFSSEIWKLWKAKVFRNLLDEKKKFNLLNIFSGKSWVFFWSSLSHLVWIITDSFA